MYAGYSIKKPTMFYANFVITIISILERNQEKPETKISLTCNGLISSGVSISKSLASAEMA